jgi:hypothetical protein
MCLASPGGRDNALRAVIEMISDAALCIDCIVRKANVGSARVEEVLGEVGRHYKIVDLAACHGCLRVMTIYGLSGSD